MEILINLKRFILTPLKEYHVTDEYLSWFEDIEAKKYIDYATEKKSKDDLKDFIRSKDSRSDVLFLAIFEKTKLHHIGNIKYEPIDIKTRTATMGILIGANYWRGKGVAPEVISGSALWLKRNMGISRIFLGVDKYNTSALKAYTKIGFREFEDQLVDSKISKMVMDL